MSYIRWFNEIGAGDVELVGGKGANLGEMARAKFPVPPGFCVTAPGYRHFLETTGLDQTIRTILENTRMDDPIDLEAKSAEIRASILAEQMPTAIAAEVHKNYIELGERMGMDGGNLPVAVRSSATAEDLPTASFAGQQDTYLNVRGESALVEHIHRCWASGWTARAVKYRNIQGFEHLKVYVSVVVQAMIPSEISGILFTANPVTGSMDEAIINASWGLGEAIVSGLVSPDTITARKNNGEVIDLEIGSKAHKIEYATNGGTVELETPADLQNVPALSKKQVAEIVAIGSRIENHYRVPQDIEWGYARDKWYILQSRPITTLDEYNRSMFIEIFPDPLSPVFLSVIKPLFKGMLDFLFEDWGFKVPKEINAIGIYYNQPYFNRRYVETTLAPLSPKVREPLVATIVNPFSDEKEESATELSLPFLRMVSRILRFLTGFPKQLPGLLATYHKEVAEVEAMPLESASDSDIANMIHRLLFEVANMLLYYDYMLIAVIKRTYKYLGSLLESRYQEDAEQVVASLVSGVTGNVTMETNKHLWDLAQVAKNEPVVRDLFYSNEAGEVMDKLVDTPEASPFLKALEEFLGEFGHREVQMEISYPTWREDPTPVLIFVRSYLDADDEQSPHVQQARLVGERKALTDEVLARVAETTSGRFLVSPLFRWILNQAQLHTRERDTMHFELTRMFPPFRKMLLELGRRWREQDLIEDQEDIFFITLDEIVEIAAAPRAMKEEVRSRRAEYETNKTRPWPSIIRGKQEIYAGGGETADFSGDTLEGVPGSPGQATGISRVIRGPEEFAKLQKGDILVAPLTNPVWTPLFALAGGVITEVGGILSHGAIVAREYGIPAVMSVPGATHHIPEGEQILVDGSQGVVKIGLETAA
jgi:pyruvate,water dikinase